MNVIKTIIADLNAVLIRLETEVGMHPAQAAAGAAVKQAATAIAQHPDAQAVTANPANDVPAGTPIAPDGTAIPASA